MPPVARCLEATGKPAMPPGPGAHQIAGALVRSSSNHEEVPHRSSTARATTTASPKPTRRPSRENQTSKQRRLGQETLFHPLAEPSNSCDPKTVCQDVCVSTPSPPPPTAPFKKTRQYLAVALILLYAVAAIWFYRECVEVLSTDATGLTTSTATCSPPTLTSGTVLVLLALVGALLWPDLSEVSVLGVGVKREAERAQQTAESVREGLNDLRTVVLTQNNQIDLNATSSASNQIYVNYAAPESLNTEQRGVMREQADAIRKTAGGDTPGASVNSENESAAEAKLSLLGKFERLASILGLNEARGRGRPSNEAALKREAQKSFRDENFNRIRSVQAVRNEIAHGRNSDREDVDDALLILDDLILAAEKHIERIMEHPTVTEAPQAEA